LDQQQASRRFYDLVWPYRADVLRVARFLCHDHSVADDLAQETLLKAFRAIGGVEASGGNLKAWLLVILRNTWKDWLRRHRPDESLETLEEEPQIDAVDDAPPAEFWKDPQALIDAFSDQQVIDALKALPQEIRWTLLLVDVEGVSVQEAADILAVPVGTIKSRAHRGRAMLRKLLLPLEGQQRLILENAKFPNATDRRQDQL
jgi:RNA polymerase sigma-70 factor (ECF subfamily)